MMCNFGPVIGDGAVIDHQFNTTDVCSIVQTDHLIKRHSKRYLLDPHHRKTSENLP